MKKIPMRPSDASAKRGLTNDEMDCLSYYVISGCKKEDAFRRFVSSDFVKARPALLYETNKLFENEYAKKYIEAYKITLEEFLTGSQEFLKDFTNKGEVLGKISSQSSVEPNKEEIFKKRKSEAIKNFTDYVFDQAENIFTVDDPEALVKIADKMGLFENLDDNVEPPRRYLPEICSQSCRYRLFCEENIANGNIVDECKFCLYKAYANKNGVQYDDTNMLYIPIEQDSLKK